MSLAKAGKEIVPEILPEEVKLPPCDLWSDVVLGSDPHPRRSWMVWVEHGKYPNLIIELLSDSTAKVDREFKKQLYQDTFRTPEYFWVHPQTLEFKGFRLMGGHYRPIKPNAQGWLWSQQLELFVGIQDKKLRFFTEKGECLISPQRTLEICTSTLRNSLFHNSYREF